MKKIVSIVGARPQFIKAALISKKLRAAGCNEVLVHTGQHYDFNMSDIFFQQLGIPDPDYYLGVGSGLHGEQTGKMLAEIEQVVKKENPDIVVIYGDTNTTLAGALVASKLHVPVAHVEAGLRSYNKLMPEEINRVLADHVSNILFCPSRVAVSNLLKEGFSNIVNNGNLVDISRDITQIDHHQAMVVNVGDVMFDVARETIGSANDEAVLEKYGLEQTNYILTTIHRPENTDFKAPLQNIWDAMEEIARSTMPVFFPIHPRTRKALREFNILNESNSAGIILNEPVSYLEMLILEKNAKIIVTDSGGVQKESYFFQTPCVIIRGQSEWVELIENGWAKLSKPVKEIIKNHCLVSLGGEDQKEWQPYYGDGKASERIVAFVATYSGQKEL
jgi:UDP-N-acetylglucosamine 2-epimerase